MEISEKFENWLLQTENKKATTSATYASSIFKISDHYSQQIGKHIDIYDITSIDDLKEIVSLYSQTGKYSEIGQTGHGTYRAAIKALLRYRSNGSTSSSTRIRLSKKINPALTQNKKTLDLFEEAQVMSQYYAQFYAIERSLRKFIVEVLQEKYGENWWDNMIHYSIKENVNRNIESEMNSRLSKRSEDLIDYTLFSDLKKIITYNWDDFKNHFTKPKKHVGDILDDLNKLRWSIAHCTPMPEIEVSRFNVAISDWYRALKK